jgi:outer membrane lipoprotein-sorting protein
MKRLIILNIIFWLACFGVAKNSYSIETTIQSHEAIVDLYKSELDQIENYLNNIKNLSANFIQKSSEGAVFQGKFYLSRPGKMRIEYINQPPIVIVVNGAVLTYHDLELDEISNLSTNTTPASFLTRRNISFSAKDVELTGITKKQGYITVSVMKKNRKEAGEFSLTFKKNPHSSNREFSFIKMEVKNDLGQIVTVELSDVQFPETINNNLFIMKNKNLP